MKKKIIIILIILAIILFFPIRQVLNDGGTVQYKSLVYTITKYHKLTQVDSNVEYMEGLEIKLLGIKIYSNLKNNQSESPNTNIQENDNNAELDAKKDNETKHSFVGTILEEDTTYMLVQPNEDEEERKLYDKIKICYGVDHIDYLFGKGRKVIINYTGEVIPKAKPDQNTDSIIEEFARINTNDILVDGYENFKLTVKKSSKIKKVKILNAQELWKIDYDYNLYYYGLEEVNITINNETMSLEKALFSGKMTLNGLIAQANKDFPDTIPYNDGGSMEYHYKDYAIIKVHKTDGNMDVYIGINSMKLKDLF